MHIHLYVLRLLSLWQNKTWHELIEGRTGDVTQSSSPFLLAVVSVKGSFSSWKHYLSPWAWQVSALSTRIRPPAQTRHGSAWPRQQHTSASGTAGPNGGPGWTRRPRERTGLFWQATSECGVNGLNHFMFVFVFLWPRCFLWTARFEGGVHTEHIHVFKNSWTYF